MMFKKLLLAACILVLSGTFLLPPVPARAQTEGLCGSFRDEGYYYLSFYINGGSQYVSTSFTMDDLKSMFGFDPNSEVVWFEIADPSYNRSGVLTGFSSINQVNSCGSSSAAEQPACGDQFEPNDETENATPLDSGVFFGSICPSTDIDLFKLSVDGGETIYVHLTDLPADLDMTLFNSAGVQMAESAHGGVDREDIKWTSSQGQDVYLVIYGYDSVSSSDPYSLGVYQGDVARNLEQIQERMSEEDFDNFRELLKYVVDSQRCVYAARTTLISGPVSLTLSCAGAASEILNVISAYIDPGGVYGDRGDIGSMDLNAYCAYKFGTGASAVMTDQSDAFSWGCYKNNQYVGGLDMEEVCASQFPDLPHVIYSRWDAYSWQCVP